MRALIEMFLEDKVIELYDLFWRTASISICNSFVVVITDYGIAVIE